MFELICLGIQTADLNAFEKRLIVEDRFPVTLLLTASKRRLERKFRITHQSSDKSALTEQKNLCTTLIENKRKSFYRNEIR